MDEILEMLRNEKSIYVIGCGGCAEVCKTGGLEACDQMVESLIESGKKVTGYINIDILCNRMLNRIRMKRENKLIKKSDAILVLSCGIGVQAVGSIAGKPVYPASNTIYMDGFQGIWPGDERCNECGECYLGITSGLCPVTSCSKGLLNGPCGGAKNGKCEVDRKKECGWHKIYERLKKLDRLENLNSFVDSRDYRKMIPDEKLRREKFYNIDNDPKEQ